MDISCLKLSVSTSLNDSISKASSLEMLAFRPRARGWLGGNLRFLSKVCEMESLMLPCDMVEMLGDAGGGVGGTSSVWWAAGANIPPKAEEEAKAAAEEGAGGA